MACFWTDIIGATQVCSAGPEPPARLELLGDVAPDPANMLSNPDPIYACVPLSDGSYMFGGPFVSTTGGTRSGMFHANAAGSVLSDFPNSQLASVYDALLLPSGEVLVGGNFSAAGGISGQSGAAVISLAGVVNTSFNAADGIAPWRMLRDVSGAVYVFNNSGAERLFKMNADGTLDTTLSSSTLGTQFEVMGGLQTSGKLVFGWATTFGSLYRVARATVAGAPDSSFVSVDFDGPINGVFVMKDDRLLVYGSFVNVGGVARNGFAVLLPDGTLDTAVAALAHTAPYSANDVKAAIELSDGTFLVAGFLHHVAGNFMGVLRLDIDGSIDITFAAYSAYNILTTNDGDITRLLQLADDSVMMLGEFSLLYGSSGGSSTRRGAARII